VLQKLENRTPIGECHELGGLNHTDAIMCGKAWYTRVSPELMCSHLLGPATICLGSETNLGRLATPLKSKSLLPSARARYIIAEMTKLTQNVH
jgi:hypothetical protein